MILLNLIGIIKVPQRYSEAYNKNNQNAIDNTINATRKSHELILASTESFNKSIEISQEYYNDSVKNYFNFVNRLENLITTNKFFIIFLF